MHVAELQTTTDLIAKHDDRTAFFLYGARPRGMVRSLVMARRKLDTNVLVLV